MACSSGMERWRARNFPPWLPAFSGNGCAHPSQVFPAWKVGRRNNRSSRLALPASSSCSPALRSVNSWVHCVPLALQPAVVRWVCKAKRLHLGRAGEGSPPPPPAVSPSTLTWWMSSWMCHDQGAPGTLFGSTFFHINTHTPVLFLFLCQDLIQETAFWHSLPRWSPGFFFLLGREVFLRLLVCLITWIFSRRSSDPSFGDWWARFPGADGGLGGRLQRRRRVVFCTGSYCHGRLWNLGRGRVGEGPLQSYSFGEGRP